MANQKTIYLEIDDEITSVVEKVRQSSAEYVTLVIPKNAVLLQSIVNLKLLARSSEKLKKHVAVVTTDKGARNLLLRAGLPLKKHIGDEFPDPVAPATPEKNEISLRESLDAEDIEEVVIADSPRKKDEAGEDSEAKKIAVKTYNPRGESETKEVRAPELAAVKIADEVLSDDEERQQRVRILKSQRTAQKSRLPKTVAKWTSLFVGVALIVVAVVLYFTLPKATITLTPKSEPASDDVEIGIVTNSEPNPDLGEISGRFVEISKTEKKTYSTTGEKDFGEKASGDVTIENTYSSDAQELVAGTRLQTTAGLIYRLDKKVIVPGATIEEGTLVAGTITAHVTADEFGDAYNSDAVDLTIPGLSAAKQAKITATASSFTGGTSEVKKVVSEEDIKKAKEETEKAAKNLGREEMKKSAEAGEIILDDAIALSVSKSEPSLTAGKEGSEFTYEVVVKVESIALPQDALEARATEGLAKRLEGEKVLVDGEKGSFTYTAKKLDTDKKSLAITTHVEKVAIPALNVEDFKRDLRDKTKAEVMQYFAEKSEIEGVKVDFWPFWVNKTPGNSDSLTITLDT